MAMMSCVNVNDKYVDFKGLSLFFCT